MRGIHRTSGLGSTFLTGVDRRVQAPLGTVVKFSGVLTRASSGRRGRRFIGVVGGGDSLLLHLVASVLSFSGVRSNILSCSLSSADLGSVFRRRFRMRTVGVPRGISLVYSFSTLPSVFIRASPGQIARILSGLVSGTIGFARIKDVEFSCHVMRGCMLIRMVSANVKVSPRRRRTVFSHFIGIGSFGRKANLNLAVYGAVVRTLGKAVNISSEPKRNTQF